MSWSYTDLPVQSQGEANKYFLVKEDEYVHLILKMTNITESDTSSFRTRDKFEGHLEKIM